MNRNQCGERNPNWNGGKYTDKSGYVVMLVGCRKRRFEHTVIVEKVLGKKLPPKAETHHMDNNKSNNSNKNLVICNDAGYHMLLHSRAMAKGATGDVNSKQCHFCKEWDSLENIILDKPHHTVGIHKKCRSKYMKRYYKKVC